MLTAIKCYVLRKKADRSIEMADWCRAIAEQSLAASRRHADAALRAKLKIRRLQAKKHVDEQFARAGREIAARAHP